MAQATKTKTVIVIERTKLIHFRYLPFSEDWIYIAHNLDGTYFRSASSWTFPIEKKAAVLDAAMATFGALPIEFRQKS